MRSSPGISMYVIPATVQKTTRAISHIEKMFERAISKVIQEAAVTIEKDAKTNAPVDYSILRASIYRDFKGRVSMKNTGVGSSTKPVIVRQVVSESSRNGLNALVGSNVNYAIYMEEGRGPFEINSAVNIPKIGWRYIGTHPGYRAQPFLQPAYNKTAPKVKPAIERAMREEIKKSTLG